MKYLPVPNRPNYFVGSDGSVWSLMTGEPKKRTLTPNKRSGRLYVILSTRKRVSLMQVSRLVLETFSGPCPPGMECCHNNGNYLDNRPDNLRWDTHGNNMKDCDVHDSFATARGEKNHNAILTSEVVTQIVSFYAAGMKMAGIARRMGLRPSRVNAVLKGIVWSHVTGIPKRKAGKRKRVQP